MKRKTSKTKKTASEEARIIRQFNTECYPVLYDLAGQYLRRNKKSVTPADQTRVAVRFVHAAVGFLGKGKHQTAQTYRAQAKALDGALRVLALYESFFPFAQPPQWGHMKMLRDRLNELSDSVKPSNLTYFYFLGRQFRDLPRPTPKLALTAYWYLTKISLAVSPKSAEWFPTDYDRGQVRRSLKAGHSS